MKPGLAELRWAYLLFALLALETLLVAWLAPRPAALVLVLPLLAVQGVAMWLAPRIVTLVRGHRLLKESFEQELDFARQVMESVDHGLTVLDGDGRFTYVNRAYAQMLGLPASALVGRTPFEFTVPDDHAQLQEGRRAREAGQASSYRTRLRRTDGTTLDVIVTGTPQWHKGRIVGNFAVIAPLRELMDDLCGDSGARHPDAR